MNAPLLSLGSAANRPRVGIALGAGAARGWSHIGVLRELALYGISPDVIAGTSIGAVVGGCYAAGKLDEIEAFARSLTKRRVFGLMDFSLAGIGLMAGGRLKARLDNELLDMNVEGLARTFGAVATEVGTGHEIWLTKGNLVESIRASYALPGIFEPVRYGGRWLFDGALVNPVPVTLCRALGAELVIAVNLVGDHAYRGTVLPDHSPVDKTWGDMAEEVAEAAARRTGFLAGLGDNLRRPFSRRGLEGAPGIATVMMDAFNITQDRISRSRLAGDPPDVMIHARLGKIGLFDFHRAEDLIALGREAARRVLPDIAEYIALAPTSVDLL